MRVLILIGALTAQSLWAETPTTCVNLNGAYTLPLGKHDRTGDNPFLLIRQDHCRLIQIVIAHGGAIPITPNRSLDGTEGFFIVGDSIVQKGDLAIPTADHGECSANKVSMTLDADRNLVFSSPKVWDCEKQYKGAIKDTFPRAK